jgi:hypothetical protein
MMSEYAQHFPEYCPPADAQLAANVTFFRLVKNFPPAAEDFWSYKKLNPDHDYKFKACEACALSVVTEIQGAKNLLKLPTQKGKKIARLKLTAAAGVYQKTGKDLYHYSWWLYHHFNPIDICEALEADKD